MSHGRAYGYSAEETRRHITLYQFICIFFLVIVNDNMILIYLVSRLSLSQAYTVSHI